ncbi:MAG: hypothetical protein ACK5MW_04905 [Enterococcus sp.]
MTLTNLSNSVKQRSKGQLIRVVQSELDTIMQARLTNDYSKVVGLHIFNRYPSDYHRLLEILDDIEEEESKNEVSTS